MTVNRIKPADVLEYLRLDEAQEPLIKPMMVAAKQYILDYTGMTEDDLDDHEDLYIAFMVLMQDMYDTRALYVDKNNVNRVVDSILFRHRTNFV